MMTKVVPSPCRSVWVSCLTPVIPVRPRSPPTQPDHDSSLLLLTHLPLDKMAAILADDIFKCIFLNENDIIPIQISLKVCSQESNWQ